ncbi:MAG: hypothetical protein U0136_20415 [Bdellovibrionota bacterium]
MAKIRADVRRSVAEDRESHPKYVPPPAKDRRPGTGLIEFEELSYLNAHWNDWSNSEQLTSHRKIIGPFIVKAKQFILNVVWEHILKGYLDREKQFHMHLVRYLNESARYIDRRDHDIFWELVHKMDNDVSGLNERTDRLFDEAFSAVRELQDEAGKRANNGR